MSRKYLKNKYQIVCFLLSMLIFVLTSFVVLTLTNEKELALFIALIPIVIIFLCSTFGFYFIFQFVSFDEIGIHIYILRKEKMVIAWQDIISIQETYVYRGAVYSIKINTGKCLNLDKRKEIKEEIKEDNE